MGCVIKQISHHLYTHTAENNNKREKITPTHRISDKEDYNSRF